MKCPKCGGTGEMQICEMGFIGKDECDECHGKGYLTNDEWRKTCSTEEFAKWISNLAYACMRCGMSNGEAYCHTGYCIQDEVDAEKWLKEKYNEMS